MTKINQLLPGNVAWTSPRALGMEQDGQVYLDTQAECVFAGIPRSPAQNVKVVMVGEGEAKVELMTGWTNALPEKTFKDKIKVKEIKGR